MRRVILMLLALSLLATPAFAEVISKIAAVVNDDIITTYQLEQEVAKMLARRARGEKIPAEQISTLRRTLLEKMIEETLLQQQIKALGLKVTDAEIDEAIHDVQRQNKLTEDQLKKALAAQGLTMKAYREKLRDQILRLKLVGRQVQSKVDVSDSDIREYFRAHIDDFREPPYVRLSNILIPIPEVADAARVEAARQLAGKVVERLRSGESYAAVLDELKAQGQGTGSDMGRFQEKELSREIARKLEGLNPGDYSDPLEKPNGFIIFRVDERVPGSIRNFDLVKAEIRQKLIDEAREREFKKWSEAMKKDAYIDIRI
ncbi:MAG: hypothetical protein D6751_09375 [Deltaproteobacteria bacterium]|nr:MAG: hypothetical protein D6751_09375 [Deltaproteobacteria bacterium]